jgi:hypothetical protein
MAIVAATAAGPYGRLTTTVSSAPRPSSCSVAVARETNA